MTSTHELDLTIGAITAPDHAARTAARARQLVLTKPTGALGRLEEISIWAAGVQRRCPPQLFRRPVVVVFAADHGIATAGVSAYPAEVTAQMVGNFLAGGAAVNVMARQVGAAVRVVDVGVNVDVEGADSRWKVRRGSRRLDEADALDRDDVLAAIRNGATIARDAISDGADLLIPGDMGIGSTTMCAAVVAGLAGLPAEEVVGRGTGVDDAGWAKKVEAVRAGLARLNGRQDPIDVLTAVGGLDVSALAGYLLAAAASGAPVLLDGIVSCTAALAAAALRPEASAWWLAGHRSTEPAQQAALAALGLQPVLDLGLRLGEGTGALAALPLVQLAIATLAEMATFGDAGVSDREH
jgi:nicotinate-nucleotide--dimethylbenzimidazole phosphoribosyltransferase